MPTTAPLPPLLVANQLEDVKRQLRADLKKARANAVRFETKWGWGASNKWKAKKAGVDWSQYNQVPLTARGGGRCVSC